MISQVAIRYAEALFQLAEEENNTLEIYSEISEMSNLIKTNTSLYDVLRSPFISRDEKRNVANEIFAGKVSKNSKNFLMVLIDNNRTTEFESVVLAYKDMLNDKQNVSEGKVITAIPLTNEQISELEEKLSARYNKSIKLVNEISEDIIGGVLVKIGNEEIDGTVKSRLGNLKEVLSQVIS